MLQSTEKLLKPHHRNEWLEWRIRQLEEEQRNKEILIEDITNAIAHIDPAAYYEYIEQPSLDRKKGPEQP